MKKHVLAWGKGLLQYGIGIGLLYYLIRTNWEPAGGSKGIKWLLEQTPDYTYLFAIFSILFVCNCLSFVRWYVLVRAIDLPFTIRNAFRLGMVGLFYNAFLPGSIGGDLVKAYFIVREQPARRAAAVATVVADRLVGLFGLLLYSAAVGGTFWALGNDRILDNDKLKWVIGVCGVLVGVAVVMWLVMGLIPPTRADRFAHRLARLPKVGNTLAEVWFAVWTYRQRPLAVASVIAITAIIHTGYVVTFHMAVRVFPTSDPGTLIEHFVVIPVGLILQVFSPSPGGAGGGEWIFGEIYVKFLGRPEPTTGIIGRLVWRSVEWTFGLVGYMCFLSMRAELPTVEAAAEEKGYGLEDPSDPAVAPITQ